MASRIIRYVRVECGRVGCDGSMAIGNVSDKRDEEIRAIAATGIGNTWIRGNQCYKCNPKGLKLNGKSLLK